MEKINYVIGKSMPDVRDQHPKMEIGQKQSFMYTYMYTYTLRYFSNEPYRKDSTKLNLTTHPHHPPNSNPLYRILQKCGIA